MTEEIKNPVLILQKLLGSTEEKKKIGYQAFLRRTHWSETASIEDLKKFACVQLGLRTRHVLVEEKRIDPAFLWASQNGLETAKLRMVDAAFNYGERRHLPIPPIIVWNFFDSQAVRLIVHDGHHRAYYSHRVRKRVKAVILEPIGNYEVLEKKFRYAFQIRKRVIDLPVSRTQKFSIVTY
jgi:hypothetical protein